METFYPYLGQAVLLFFIGYIIRITNEIRTEVKITNGRLWKVEQKVMGEEKISDERQEATVKRFERIENTKKGMW